MTHWVDVYYDQPCALKKVFVHSHCPECNFSLPVNRFMHMEHTKRIIMNSSQNVEVFKLQPRFLYLEILFLSAIAVLFIISWFPSVFSLLAYEMIIRSALRAAMFLNCTAVVLFLLYRHLKSELRRFSVVLTEDQIIKSGISGSNKIRLSDITSIKYVRIPLLRGFLKLSTNDNTMRIPLFIEDQSQLLISLNKKVSGQFKICDIVSDTTLLQDLAVFKDSSNRSLNVFPALIGISLSMFTLSTFIAIEFWDLALIPLLLFAMTSLLLPLLGYAIADYKISQSVRNFFRTDTATIHNTATEYLYSGLLIFFLYLSLGILFKAVFLWNY